MKPVRLILNVEVDSYNQEESYFGEIVSIEDNKVLYDHFNALKSFAFKEDMLFDLNRKCAEYGYEIVEVVDETFATNIWEQHEI